MFNCRACEVDTPVRFSFGGTLVADGSNGSHNRMASNGVYSYLYDNEGNLTSKTLIATGAVTEYTWEHRNRLTKVVQKISLAGSTTKVVRYVYDAFDRKVAKQLDRDGNGTIGNATRWVYDGAHAALEWEDSDGSSTVQPYRLSNRFLYGDAVDMLLADEQYASGQGPARGSTTASTQSGLNLWTLGDHLNRIRDVVDNNGIVRQHVNYDRFGQRIREVDRDSSGAIISSASAAAIDELFGYTGRDWDTDTNLQYNRARWYDPAQGRWLSQDPIGFRAGDANLYRYVGNSPTNFTDPTGHEGWIPFPRTNDGGVVNPITGQVIRGATPTASMPNIGKGRGNFHYTENSITFRVGNVKDCDGLEKAIYQSLKRFANFNDGANDVARIELNSDNTEAYFDALGVMGFGSDFIGNADKTPVGLTFDDVNRMVMAHTLDGHMLEGKRFWTVSVKRGPYCDAEVTVTTFAYERKVGALNDWGAYFMGTSERLSIWDQYLLNIMNANNGYPTQNDWPWDSPGPRHHERDTHSPVMPDLPGYP